jgi:hypothetical protein
VFGVWDVMQGCGNWCKVGGDGFCFLRMEMQIEERAGCVGTYEPMDYRLELVHNLTFLHFIGGLQRGFSLFTLLEKMRWLNLQEHSEPWKLNCRKGKEGIICRIRLKSSCSSLVKEAVGELVRSRSQGAHGVKCKLHRNLNQPRSLMNLIIPIIIHDA